MLFTAWLNSDTHREVIEDPKWSFIGISKTQLNDSLVSVINFSTGILYSTSIELKNNFIIYRGSFIELPTFISSKERLDAIINKNNFELELNNNKSRIIRVYDKKNSLTDMIELFF